ncbi:MAG: transglutaminase domain-containing protein [Candidatus Anstonellales archaeon]
MKLHKIMRVVPIILLAACAISENYYTKIYNGRQPNNIRIWVSKNVKSENRNITMEEIAKKVTIKVRSINGEHAYEYDQVISSFEVLTTGTGQCMEKATVALQVIRDMGVEALPAIVVFGLSHESRTEYLKHAVLLVYLNGKRILYDPSQGFWSESPQEYISHCKELKPEITHMHMLPFEKTDKPVIKTEEEERYISSFIDRSKVETYFPK